MAVTYQTKTEVALTTNPQTISYPASTAADDMLILIATSATSATTLAPTALHLSKWRWAYVTNTTALGQTNMSILVGWKRYFGASDDAPSIGTATTGYALMYRYSGVGSVRLLGQSGVAAANQDTPYVSASSGEEVIWYGAQRRTTASPPTTVLSRGTVETNQSVSQTSNFHTLVAYREALGSDINQVQATMSNAGSTANYSQSGAVVLSEGVTHVYKGRDSASNDTTGAA